MENLAIITILALQVEAIWETLKMIWEEGKLKLDRIGALAVGVVIAFGVGAKINASLGIEMKWEILDIILTGILISRGSNFIHDLLSKISKQ